MGSLDDPADFNLDTYEGSKNVQVAQGYLVTAASFAFFEIVNGLALIYGPPKNVTSDVWRWRNTFVSWVHADLIGVGVISCFVFRQEMYMDMILYCDLFTYSVIAFSLGYFFYDILDHIVNKRVVSNWEVVLHHVGVIYVFAYGVHHRINIGYTIMALLTEVNSIFLHARKLMQFDRWPFDHWLYRTVVILNLITFIVFRITAVILVGVFAYIERKRISIVFLSILAVVMIVMYFINPILLWRLVKSDFLRNKKKKTAENGKTAPSRGKLKGEQNGLKENGNPDHLH